MTYVEIVSFKQLLNCLRDGKYTSIGSYPIYFIAADESYISYDGVKENIYDIGRAMRNRYSYNNNLIVIGYSVNLDNKNLYCQLTNSYIETAYSEQATD